MRSTIRCLLGKHEATALQQLGAVLGLGSQYTFTQQHLFTPLLTADFTFEQGHLSSLGEAVIEETIAACIHDYCVENGHLLTPNTSTELLAVMHNHYAHRIIADKLQLLEHTTAGYKNRVEQRRNERGDTSETTESDQKKNTDGSPIGDGDDEEDSAGFVKDLLETPVKGPNHKDLKGTSYDVPPHTFAQSAFPEKLTHLIGAVQMEAGEEAATAAVKKLWGLAEDNTNVPRVAAKLLAESVDRYHRGPVALSLLAAQQMSVTFTSRSIQLDPEDGPSPAGAAPFGEDNTARPPDEESSDETILATATSSSGGGDGGMMNAPTNSAGPPSGSSSRQVEMWRRRSQAPQTIASSGWLTPPGDATGSSADPMSSSGDIPQRYFADAVGNPHPATNGAHIINRRYGDVEDPVFGHSTFGKDGLQIDTGGLPLQEFLNSFNRPQPRIFEVTMIKQKALSKYLSKEPTVVVGRAVASRYSTARVNACSAYLTRVLKDLRKLAETRLA